MGGKWFTRAEEERGLRPREFAVESMFSTARRREVRGRRDHIGGSLDRDREDHPLVRDPDLDEQRKRGKREKRKQRRVESDSLFSLLPSLRAEGEKDGLTSSEIGPAGTYPTWRVEVEESGRESQRGKPARRVEEREGADLLVEFRDRRLWNRDVEPER